MLVSANNRGDEPKNIGKYTSDGEKRVTEKINGIERFLGKIKNIL